MRRIARASRSKRSRRDWIERILATQRDVASGDLDLQAALNLVCERAQELTRGGAANVVMVEGGELRIVASSGFASGRVGVALGLESSLSGWVLANGDPALCNDAIADPRVDATLANELGVRSLVSVQLLRGEAAAGVVNVLSERPGAFTEKDVDALRLLSVVLSSALSSASELEAKRAQIEALGRYRTIFEGASVGIVRVDGEGRNVEANPAMEQMLGYTSAELASMSFRAYTHPDDVERNVALFKAMMAGELDVYQLEKRCYAKDGSLIWVQVTAALERDTDGAPAFVIAMLEDISERKLAEEALAHQAQLNEHQALHDALTGLGNRRKLWLDFERRLHTDAEPFALALLDLDGFKMYNDTFGHPAGDALLARLGGRVAAAVDGRGCAYRTGGDEFCVVVRGDVERMLEKARDAFKERGEGFSISCSCGSVAIPAEAETLESALQLADQRLYADKRGSRPAEDLEVRDALLQVIAEQSLELTVHVGAVAELAALTATKLGLSSEDIAHTRVAAQLHDIGKAAVPAAILEKPGPLDDGEWELIRCHTLIGERIVTAAPSLAKIAPIVRSSHERPDGSGYPDGLQMDEIPIGSRIIAVVDAFDAMVTGRPYRQALPVEAAIEELRRCAGSQFDPGVVEAFFSVVTDRAGDRVGAEPEDEPLVRATARRSVPGSILRMRSGERTRPEPSAPTKR